MTFLLTIMAVSTKSTTSVTFSLLSDAQFSSFSLSSTSSQSLISLPSDKYTCVVADMMALLCSFSVYVCSAVNNIVQKLIIRYEKIIYLHEHLRLTLKQLFHFPATSPTSSSIWHLWNVLERVLPELKPFFAIKSRSIRKGGSDLSLPVAHDNLNRESVLHLQLHV